MHLGNLVIIGFGSQAKAWAQNIHDSGEDVFVALRPESKSVALAQSLGFKTLCLEKDDLTSFRNFALLTPDHTHKEILERLSPQLEKESNLIYAHGYSVMAHKLDELFPHFHHLLLAPKAIASELRSQFLQQGKLAAAISTEKSKNPQQSQLLLETLCQHLGINVGPFKVSFLEETFTDLFSEQSLLCSLLPYGALRSYQKLRERDISPEMAYLECWYEVKLIVDTMIQLGPQKFFSLISPNALIGGEKARQLLFDKAYQKQLEKLIQDIWSGTFFNECETTDSQKLRDDVLKFWDEQELSHTHKKMAPLLFGTSKNEH